MTITSLLVEKIINKGEFLNPNQVANHLDFDPSHLNKLMKGKANPNAENFLRLAKEAGLSIDEAHEILRNKNKYNGFISLSLVIVTAILMSLIYIGVFSDVIHTLYIMRS